tara:strand:+ start:6430 stop:6984 length:555 start_codon:yes stop_codon:yes gene_type:complete
MPAKKKTTTDAASHGLATPSGSAFDFEAARAKSVLASNRMIELVDVSERMSVGSWYFPNGWPDERLKKWHFVRCGTLRSEASLALSSQLSQFGYQKAPAGVRCVGFEGEGENMLVMMAPLDVRMNMRRIKAIEKAKIGRTLKDSFGDVQAAVGTHGQVHVVGGSGKGSEGDFREAMRGANVITG